MATIFAVTTIEMSREERKNLSDALIQDLGTLYKHAMSCNIAQIPDENCRGDELYGGAHEQTTFFVCVPPYISLEKKRETVKLINDTMVREVGYRGVMKVVVLFQYHDDDGVGKDGELFSDILAKRAAETASAGK